MKYYISITDVEINEAGRLSGCERVLTKPDTLRATKESLRRLTAIGIENLHICKHPANSRRWGKLQRAQNKLRKTRKLTMADVAKDLAELNAESTEENDS
tara:strand:+ start:1400 stop:1699 length:300 start_codon:yes stop_codon:yes gene_type:complete